MNSLFVRQAVCERGEPIRHTSRRAATALGVGLLMVMLTGCSGYQLEGKAVEGATSAIFIVDADDPRLEQQGIPGAVVSLMIDPRRPSAKRAGRDVTDMDGRFAIPIDEFGAGVLEYDAQLETQSSNHRGAADQFMLPGRDKRVLIVLEEGAGGAPPRGESFLDETLRLGDPYMD